MYCMYKICVIQQSGKSRRFFKTDISEFSGSSSSGHSLLVFIVIVKAASSLPAQLALLDHVIQSGTGGKLLVVRVLLVPT